MWWWPGNGNREEEEGWEGGGVIREGRGSEGWRVRETQKQLRRVAASIKKNQTLILNLNEVSLV